MNQTQLRTLSDLRAMRGRINARVFNFEATGKYLTGADLFFFLQNFFWNFARVRRRHQITDQIIQFVRAKS